MILLYRYLGISMLGGVGVMFLMMPINVLVARKLGKSQENVMEKKDIRVKTTSEVLAGIRICKFFAWEPLFKQKLEKIRFGIWSSFSEIF